MLKKRQKAYKRKRIIAVLIIISVLAIFKVALAKENTISVKVADETNQSDDVPDSLTVTEVTEEIQMDIVLKEVVKENVSAVKVETYTNSQQEVIQIIKDAAAKYEVSETMMLRIAKCESGYNQNAVNYNYYENGYPSGLFQHLSGYWAGRAKKYGYEGESVFDPVANANVTAGMMRDGFSYLWECK